MAIVTFNGGESGHTANKGSCAELEKYKEHENELRSQEDRLQVSNAKCRIFGADGIMSSEESTRFIDGHRKGLRKDEAKFYEFEINLSEGEQQAMFKDCASEAQKEKAFQEYIRNVAMEEYAQNFKGYADKAGNTIDFHKENICWTAVIHTERYGTEAVKWKKEHPDMPRADWHTHITVAHRTMDQARSISPKKNQRSSNKGSCQGYFDRNSFRQRIEQTIDMHFGYDRPLSDTLNGRQEQRNKNEKERMALLNDVNCERAKKQGHDEAMARIAAVKQRKHMEAEALKARLEREAAERRAAAEAKRQAEQKAREEAGRKRSAALKSAECQSAISAIVANAKDMSKPMRNHISAHTAHAIFLALGKVDKELTRNLTEDLISAAKNGMGTSPINWVELLRPDIEKVADVSVTVKSQIGTGENYDKAFTPDDWSSGEVKGISR